MQFGVHEVIVDCVEPWILAVAVIVGLLVALLILVAASIVRERERERRDMNFI